MDQINIDRQTDDSNDNSSSQTVVLFFCYFEIHLILKRKKYEFSQ